MRLQKLSAPPLAQLGRLGSARLDIYFLAAPGTTLPTWFGTVRPPVRAPSLALPARLSHEYAVALLPVRVFFCAASETQSRCSATRSFSCERDPCLVSCSARRETQSPGDLLRQTPRSVVGPSPPAFTPSSWHNTPSA